MSSNHVGWRSFFYVFLAFDIWTKAPNLFWGIHARNSTSLRPFNKLYGHVNNWYCIGTQEECARRSSNSTLCWIIPLLPPTTCVFILNSLVFKILVLQGGWRMLQNVGEQYDLSNFHWCNERTCFSVTVMWSWGQSSLHSQVAHHIFDQNMHLHNWYHGLETSHVILDAHSLSPKLKITIV